MENYNSKYPIEYYELGKVYAFYGRYFASAAPAQKNIIEKYASCLDNKSSLTTEATGKLIRYVGVVVGKDKAKSHIYVLFKNVKAGQEEYLINVYKVGCNCETNDKELMPIADLVKGVIATGSVEIKENKVAGTGIMPDNGNGKGTGIAPEIVLGTGVMPEKA